MPSTTTLIHILTANRWGGVERYALDICRHFVNSGWRVAAVTRGAKAVDALFEKEGVELLHAPFAGMLDFASIRCLTGALKKSRGEKVIIHAHGFRNAFTALVARKLAGRKDVRIVATRHKVKKGLDSALFRRIYRNLDAIICVSKLAADRFISAWHNRQLPFPPERLHILHNSIYLPDGLPLKNETKGPVTAMFHGPILQGKGLESLIDAMAMLKNERMRLRIVGSGTPDYVDRLRRRAITRGVMDKIDWYKYTPNPLQLIQEADFGVLPSLAEEAFGLSNIEYMACGKPQICSSNGAQPEYITDGREGFLIPPANVNLLAESMRKLANDPELRERMGQHALDTFNQSLTWQNFIEKLASLYLPS
ncbi:MAG: glycosyltransferase family 4 protein [Muribaculaceae bacterium]|nr:glycosyltransferase family 4 protein [Muribaculaceae bacterium]MDE6008781.1 glycosyltransferase family 4 protein [Muribaculaceae bacterium]MDE6791833.1 glycosyltransferase family 4 protein [Muribaculaceae bacterium]